MNRPANVNAYDPTTAAAELVRAWRDARQLDELPAGMRPRTLAQGYDVQEAFVAQTGAQPTGWKLGVGSPSAMRRAGLERPLIGRLLASRCHRIGDIVSIPGCRPVTIEFEIAFILGRDICNQRTPDDADESDDADHTGRPGTSGSRPCDPMDAVAATHVAFELVLSRYVDRRNVGHPSFVGDNAAFEAFVLGDAIDPRRIADVRTSAQVEIDGRCAARGLHGADVSDPATALAYLFDHARERGITLRRGDIVTTGAAAQPIDVAERAFDVNARYLDTSLPMRVRTV